VLSVGDIFQNGTMLKDTYSGKIVAVYDGKITLNTPYSIILLEKE
jgi:alpha-amylase